MASRIPVDSRREAEQQSTAETQRDSNVYRVKFTELEYYTRDEKLDPSTNEIPASKTLNARTGLQENSKKRPWYLPLPSKENPSKSRILLSWEADAIRGAYSDGALNGRAPELRIERVFSDDAAGRLEGWRADRQWRTNCTRDVENPSRLVFASNLTDFRRFPVKSQDIMSQSVITLRGQFYDGGNSQPVLADEENRRPVYVLYDGMPPSITITTCRLIPKRANWSWKWKSRMDRRPNRGRA